MHQGEGTLDDLAGGDYTCPRAGRRWQVSRDGLVRCMAPLFALVVTARQALA